MTFTVVCVGCELEFEAKTRSAKWHSAACRKRNQRAAARSSARQPAARKPRAKSPTKKAPAKKTAAVRTKAPAKPATKTATKTAAAKKTTTGQKSKTQVIDKHGLVVAVRDELEKLQNLDTFDGQLALQLARRLANPDEASVVTLARELRIAMDAIRTPAKAPSEPDPADDDEVTEARRRRDEAREAAGLA